MIYIDNSSKIPIYEQIYQQVKDEITTGSRKAGDKLISTRALAKMLCVARNTVERAYSQLWVEGYVINKPGSGYIIQNINDNLLVELQAVSDKKVQKKHSYTEASISDFTDRTEKTYQYSFQYGDLDYESFPYSLWRRLTAEALRSDDIQYINSYNHKQGDLELRIEIMKYLKQSRGVCCTPDQIVLCSGIQYALDLICKIIPHAHRTLAMEEPGYDGAKIVFENNGFEIVPVSVGAEGISLKELVTANSKIVYITPSHQFPTGVIMPIQNRVQLLNWATENNSFIIEDDYDSEFRYNSRPIPSLQSIDNSGRVIYLGTFSKALSPGLRMSYMVLPKSLIVRYNEIFSGYHSTLPWLEQKIVSLYITNGHLERHIRKMCIANKNKHDVLIKTINDVMGEKVIIHGNNAGLHIILEFVNGENQRWLIEKAKEYNVNIYSTMPYWIEKENCPQNRILLGFSALSEKDIIEGINILNRAWFDNKK